MQKNKEKRKKIQRTLLRHESIHSAAIAMDIFCNYVQESEVVKSDEQLSKQAQKVVNKMYKMYNKIQQKSLR